MDARSIRLKLTNARADLRDTRSALAVAEAKVANTVSGKNAEERKNALVLALDADGECRRLRLLERQYEITIERLESDMEEFKDQRRDREWAIRLRLIEALERRGMEDDGRDGAFDEVADQLAWNANMNGARPKRIADSDLEIPF